MQPPVKEAVDYFVLLGPSVFRKATGEVGVAGGAPVFHVILFLSGREKKLAKTIRTNHKTLQMSYIGATHPSLFVP